MQIVPKNGPTILQPPTGNASANGSARERAIAMLQSNQPQQQESPVQNATQVSPEEMTAVRPPQKVQNDTSEAPTQESPREATKAPDEQPLSTQYAALARKEKALRAKVQAEQATLRAKEEAIKAKEELLRSKEAEYQSKYISKDKLTQDTLNTLAEAGLSYDQITNLMLNQPKPEELAYKAEIQRLEAKLKDLEEGQNKTVKSFEEQQQQSYKQAVTQIRNETQQLVTTDPSFEMIKGTNSVGDVVELIERTFQQDGILLSVEEAAQAIEEHLVEEALKITKFKKIQEKSKPVSTPPVQQQTAPKQVSNQQQLKTLTNAVGASRPLTAKERAILAFKGELKS